MKLKRMKQMSGFLFKQSNKALAKFITHEWPQAIKERELWATSLLTLSAVDAVEILRNVANLSPGGVLLHTAAFGMGKTFAMGFLHRHKLSALGKFAMEHKTLTKFAVANSLHLLRIWGQSEDDWEAFKNVFFFIGRRLLEPSTYRVVWEQMKETYAEIGRSLDAKNDDEFTIDGCRVWVLPILNAAASPGVEIQKDIMWVVCRTAAVFGKDLGYEEFMNQVRDKRGVIILDPIIWAAYQKNRKWAQAIVDHEIGHMHDFTTAGGKALLYSGMFVRSPKWKKFITLCQEVRASWYAIEKDPDPIRIKTLVAAFLTYAMHEYNENVEEPQKEEDV